MKDVTHYGVRDDDNSDAEAIVLYSEDLMRNSAFLADAICEGDFSERLPDMIAALIANDAAGYLALSRAAFDEIGRDWMWQHLESERAKSPCKCHECQNAGDILREYVQGKSFYIAPGARGSF